MKKFLFLMLSLAVSASAFAGVRNAERITKKQQLPTATRMLTKQNSSMPGILKMSHKKAIANLDERYQKQTTRTGQVITEQPEGTVVYYERTGGSSVFRYYNSSASSPWGGVTYDDQEGTVMAVENGNDIWFKNLIYVPDGYFDDYWIKGTKVTTGNKRVKIPMRQEIYNYSDGSSMIITMGTLTYGDGFSWEESEVDEAIFSISGNKLILQDSEYDGNYGGTCLGVCWDDGWGWEGFADFETELTGTGETPPDAPEAPTMYTDDDILAMGEPELYYRTGEAFYYSGGYHMGEQYGAAYIYYAEDGSTVYMRNPVYGYSSGIWVKGTISGNKITVPLGQYLSWNTSNYYGVKTAWGEVTLTPTDSITYIDFAQDASVTECTYTIDGKTITLDGTSEYVGLATIIDSAYVELDDNWYPNLDYSTVYYTYPGTPTEVTVTPAATTADVAWTDTDNEKWNIRYREYNAAASNAYSNDFDDSLEGWGFLDVDGDTQNDADYGNWIWSGDPEDENNGILASLSYGKSPDNWAFTPNILATEGSVVSVKAWSWWQAGVGATEETFSIMIARDTAESLSSFVALGEDLTASTVQVYNFNIPEEYIGDSICIAIRHTGGSGFFCIDNFFVGDPDATPNPWNYVNGITEIPYTLTGLTPETTYELHVQGVNDGGVGDWSEVAMFTTLAEGGYLRGDVDGSGNVDITDATKLINYLLYGNANPFVEDNADVDYSGDIDISDATMLINFLLYGTWPD